MTISTALSQLLPGIEWSMSNNDLATLKIITPNVQAPTVDAVNAYIVAHNYTAQRAAEYPPLANLADALVHQAMGDGGVALQAYLTACEAVKTKYPKSS